VSGDDGLQYQGRVSVSGNDGLQYQGRVSVSGNDGLQYQGRVSVSGNDVKEEFQCRAMMSRKSFSVGQ
jgi:hypothetical protein